MRRGILLVFAAVAASTVAATATAAAAQPPPPSPTLAPRADVAGIAEYGLSFDGWLEPTYAFVIAPPVEATAEPDPEPPPPPRPSLGILSAAQLKRLRVCESTDNYSVHTLWDRPGVESRATGAYQFERPTWDGVASRHRPDLVGVLPWQASPQDQDDMAQLLYAERGGAPWPNCGRLL